MPLPRKVLQTSCCTHLSFKYALQTGLGMGTDLNGTAQIGLSHANCAGNP